jgi:DNA-binding MarR family transcriptional regulator
MQTEVEALEAALNRFRRFSQLPGIERYLLARLDEGIDPTLYRPLRAIERCDAPAPGVREVAAVLDVEPSTASRLVDRLLAGALVERSVCADDRRRCQLRLSAAGKEALARLEQARHELIAELTADWGPADVAQLAALLERLYDAARRIGE